MLNLFADGSLEKEFGSLIDADEGGMELPRCRCAIPSSSAHAHPLFVGATDRCWRWKLLWLKKASW